MQHFRRDDGRPSDPLADVEPRRLVSNFDAGADRPPPAASNIPRPLGLPHGARLSIGGRGGGAGDAAGGSFHVPPAPTAHYGGGDGCGSGSRFSGMVLPSRIPAPSTPSTPRSSIGEHTPGGAGAGAGVGFGAVPLQLSSAQNQQHQHYHYQQQQHQQHLALQHHQAVPAFPPQPQSQSQMERRMTLAGAGPPSVSGKVNGGAVRSSMASAGTPMAGGFGMGTGTALSTPAGARGSSGGAPDRRMSTAKVGVGSGKAPADKRPLTDKRYQARCCNEIVFFLADNHYDKAYTAQQLMSPTGKEFYQIFEFLMRASDPNYRLATVRQEDDVCQALKRVGYPFNVSKTSLTSVGSPSTWPALLAMLAWLVKAGRLRQELKARMERADVEATFERHCALAYRAFLLGKDDEEAAQMQRCVEEVQAGQAAVRRSLYDAENERSALEAELQEAMQQPSLLAQKQEEKVAITGDVRRLHEIVAQTQTDIKEIEAETEAKRQELAAAREELASAKAANEELRAKVAAQEVKVADVAAMERERRSKEDQLQLALSDEAAADEEKAREEIELAKTLRQLEGSVKEYRSIAQRLKLIAPDDKRANGLSYDVRLDTSADTWQAMLNNAHNLKGELRQWLQQLKQQTAGAASQFCATALELEGEIAKAEADMDMLAGRWREEEHKANETVAQLQRESEAVKAEADELEKRKASAEQEAASILKERESTLRQLDQRIKMAQEEAIIQEQAESKNMRTLLTNSRLIHSAVEDHLKLLAKMVDKVRATPSAAAVAGEASTSAVQTSSSTADGGEHA